MVSWALIGHRKRTLLQVTGVIISLAVGLRKHVLNTDMAVFTVLTRYTEWESGVLITQIISRDNLDIAIH
jgi:hypothetical protein